MAKLKPKDRIEFSKINGVGPSKLKKYSDQFLSVINAFLNGLYRFKK